MRNRYYKAPFKGGCKRGMNKTEERYAAELELMVLAGEIERYSFESHKVRLADKTWYTPDFKVICKNHIEFHEVKGGYMTDKGQIKFKVAADMYPEYRWVMVQYKQKRFTIIRDNLINDK